MQRLNKLIHPLCCRNIVSTVNLGCKLDLKKIALHARNAEYNPKVSRVEHGVGVQSLILQAEILTISCHLILQNVQGSEEDKKFNE